MGDELLRPTSSSKDEDISGAAAAVTSTAAEKNDGWLTIHLRQPLGAGRFIFNAAESVEWRILIRGCHDAVELRVLVATDLRMVLLDDAVGTEPPAIAIRCHPRMVFFVISLAAVFADIVLVFPNFYLVASLSMFQNYLAVSQGEEKTGRGDGFLSRLQLKMWVSQRVSVVVANVDIDGSAPDE